MDIIPRLAADGGEWNSARDEFNVSLRPGLTFHNGQEFNASSVKYTFDRLWNLCVNHDDQVRDLYFPFGFNTTQMNATVGYGYIINETIVVDDTHVIFKLNFPYRPFKPLLCFSASFIVDASTTEIDTYINFDDVALGKAIGTGPYKITEYNTDNYINFESYNAYYQGIAAIKNIIFIKYSTSAAISADLLAGIIDFPMSIDNDYMNDFQENLMTIVEAPRENSIINYMGMNNDIIGKEYRQAINYAVDYQYIYNNLSDNTKANMTSIIPTNLLYHKDCDVPSLNITKSRQILIDAGLSGTLDEFSTNQNWIDKANSGSPLLNLNYTYNEFNDFRGDIGILMVDNLEKIGIKVNINVTTWKNFYNLMIDHPEELDLFAVGWMPDYNDPSNFINPLLSNISENNAAQVNDPWLQGKMNDGLTETDDSIREQIYFDIQDYIATDLMPWVFLGYGIETGVHTAHLEIFPYNDMSVAYFYNCSWADDVSDSDTDGISDFYENYQYGTDPNNWDPDFDNVGDSDEIFTYGTDPNNWDSDFDNVGDSDEIFTYGTDPNNWDTDFDSIGDWDEIFTYPTDPNNWDSDFDNVGDWDEIFTYSTDPNEGDSDFDGIGDWDEIFTYYTDPNEEDSDFDGIGDWDEIFTYNTDPNEGDSDFDGIGDWDEIFTYNTDPNEWDTDGDGYSDKEEIDAGSDPNDYNSIPENIEPDPPSSSDPFSGLDIPGYPIAFLLSVFIFISFGLVFFMKKKLKN